MGASFGDVVASLLEVIGFQVSVDPVVVFIFCVCSGLGNSGQGIW